MGKKKIKFTKIIIGFFVILYCLIGIQVYYYVNRIYIKNNITEIDRYIASAVEIKDESGLLHVLNTNEDTYALIYGTFKACDEIHDLFLDNYFSYVEEVTIEDGDEISRKVKESKEYSIYDYKIDGLSFDFINPYVYEEMDAIKHKNIKYKYMVKNPEYTGTLLCKISNNKIVDMIKFYEYKSINSIDKKDVNGITLYECAILAVWYLPLVFLLIGRNDFETFEDINDV